MPGRKTRTMEPKLVSIDALSEKGHGIAAGENTRLQIPGALPGEKLWCQPLAGRRGRRTAIAGDILQASPFRVEPPCQHFGVCGGCSLQHLDPAQQIVHKQAELLKCLNELGGMEPQGILAPLVGPLLGYRRKARLGVKYVAKKERVLVGFRERNAPYVADIVECKVLSAPLDTLIVPLAELIGALSIRARIPQIEVAIGDHAAAIIFRALEPPTSSDRKSLLEFGVKHDLQVYVQEGGVESLELLTPSKAELHYRLDRHNVSVHFEPLHFTQVNAEINRKIVDLVVDSLKLSPSTRVLDLFCGLGNFTLPIARQARHIVGVEGNPALVDYARRNAVRNQIFNAEFHAADLCKPESNQAIWSRNHFDRVLLDPPRSGAVEIIRRIADLRPERIVYVSCQPKTLARDAAELADAGAYRLTEVGVMDMFPHTAHVESIAVFDRC